ncbi:MAG: metallopeptidase TldD-related protein, partial [Planctomycetota bacterium]
RATAAIAAALVVACLLPRLVAGAPPEADTVMRALEDELERSMTLQLEDLQSPYFVQYAVDDSRTHRIAATAGAIVSSDEGRTRMLSTSVRVGYYDLDNTNFAGGGRRGFPGRRGRGRGGAAGAGGVAMLPVDDDYTAIRQTTWLTTDQAYKSAVETLARKRAYMEDRNLPDRPDDFARAEPVVSIDPLVALAIDAEAWEQRLRRVSARFLDHPHVLDSRVTLTASADNRYLVNSEGTRIRAGGTGVVLAISASAQADDGEELSDRITHHAAAPDGLPAEAALLAEADAMAERLAGRAGGAVLENYLGPVLFEGRAAPQLFRAVLARGVAGRPEPVGGGRRRFAGMQSLDKYLGKRILPRDFQVYDDPRLDAVGGDWLAGAYALDHEGVEAQRVDLVVNGRLEAMVMSRTPTRDFDASNGHGRSAGVGRTQAAIGCLVVEAGDGLDDEALTAALIEAARDQDLEYGLRVTSVSGRGGGGDSREAALRALRRLQQGGGQGPGSPLGDPIAVYKVFLDGREELVRGCEFGSFDVGTLKDIIAAGRRPIVHNTGGASGAPASIVAPAVLFEEMELFTIEQERPKLPIVEAPHRRAGETD